MKPLDVAFIAANAVGIGVYLRLASRGWRIPQEQGMIPVAREPFVWFEAEIYTEPLGMAVLLLSLYALYRAESISRTLFVPILLAAVILSNVFAAFTIAPMLLGYSLVNVSRAALARTGLITTSSLALSAFWWVPLVRGYWTVVTLPSHPPLSHIFDAT